MARLCGEALRLAAPDHHAARWRAALTLAGNYHFAGRLDKAQPWYAAARSHAMADGDDVAVSALMYTQASMRTAEVRLGAAFDEACRSETASAVLGAESTGQFDAVIGLQSLGWLVPMMRAQLLVLEGRHEQALALIDQHWPRCEPAWRERMAAGIEADRAWCLWHLGQPEAARAAADRAAEALQAPADVDDRALAQARLAQVLEVLGDKAAAAEHSAAAHRDCATHRAAQRALCELIDASLGEVPSAL
jgi:hypothetical protein